MRITMPTVFQRSSTELTRLRFSLYVTFPAGTWGMVAMHAAAVHASAAVPG